MQNQMDTIGTIGDETRPAPGFGGLVGRVVRVGVSLVLTWQQRVRERHMLACMDDYILRDLGLSRADVMTEAGKPFWRP